MKLGISASRRFAVTSQREKSALAFFVTPFLQVHETINAVKYQTLILVLVATLTVSASATTLDEADYPNRYHVVTTSRVGSLMIGNFCTMSLRDQANATMAFIVQRRGHG